VCGRGGCGEVGRVWVGCVAGWDGCVLHKFGMGWLEYGVGMRVGYVQRVMGSG
jgi:hypothetical protein